jgi:hypothetical protein
VSLSRIFAEKLHHSPRACEHHVIAATSLPLTGRCLDCGALVDTPFTLHTSTRSN